MTYFPHDVMDIIEPDEADHPRITQSALPPYRFRRSMAAIEIALAAASAVGAVQLFADVATPPDDQLPLGLRSWAWPAVWLLATVCVPAALAAIALTRRAPSDPAVVLAATGLLGVELVVQIPFVGLSWLQLAVGLLGAGAAAKAIVARTTKEQSC
jgi:hypothetical protein